MAVLPPKRETSRIVPASTVVKKRLMMTGMRMTAKTTSDDNDNKSGSALRFVPQL